MMPNHALKLTLDRARFAFPLQLAAVNRGLASLYV